MFGYIKAYPPELKVKEYALYKALYCGLCKSMGKCTGFCSRLTLSYDMTFLAAIRLCLENKQYEIKKERCIIHPFKKRPVVKEKEILNYCARVSAILSYAKLEDDIRDSKGVKKLKYVAVKPFLKHSAKRAGEKELYCKISEKLNELNGLEKEKRASIDEPADIFGEITSYVFAHGLCGDERKIAEKIGFNIGKWIYITDAFDDVEKDLESKSYNPLILVYGENIGKAESEMIKSGLKGLLCEVEKALDLVEFNDLSLKEIVYNILYKGTEQKEKTVEEKSI